VAIVSLREVRVPTYEYRCKACGHELETFQSIKDAPLRECPHCHKNELERLISGAAFQLKGGGWYKDLYSSKKPGSERSENDRADKLSSSIDKDKAKTKKE
jgi:putative FmdB family regulatory protein